MPLTRNKMTLHIEFRINAHPYLELTSKKNVERSTSRAWHVDVHAMLGCSTICPNCKHQFTCCAPAPPPTPYPCCVARRSWHYLSGGGVVPSLSPVNIGELIPTSIPQNHHQQQLLSPSVPLAFVIPTFASSPRLVTPPPDDRPEVELAMLTDTVRVLNLSGWYYESISFTKSDEILKNCKVGTFIVRNSSDPRYLYSLSVMTDKGPKSVRLFYVNGYFRLDAQKHVQSAMPMFPSVMELIQYYVRNRKRDGSDAFYDPDGKMFATIYLETPLRKDNKPASLKHLSRLAVHKALQDSAKSRGQQSGVVSLTNLHAHLELPTSLTAYLVEYPYSI